jgi:hypothetical protein
MDAFKGVFRRANQSVKERTGRADVTNDGALDEAIKRVRLMEQKGMLIMDKVGKLQRCFEEMGSLCVGISEDYRSTMIEGGGTPQEMVQLATELAAYGAEVNAKAQELQRNMKENAYDNIASFARDVPGLRALEEDKKKKQLEYDFFRTKVQTLIKEQPKDHSRIPRNESIRESWRTQLWQSSENMKTQVSALHSNGQRCLDSAVYTVAMTMGNFTGYALNSAKNHFVNAHLPAYNTAPLLPPAPLPPPPPPYQQPVPQYGHGGPGAPGAPPAYGSQPSGQYGTPQHQHQHQHQQHPGQFSPQHPGASPQQQYGSPQSNQYASPNPQGAPAQQPAWNNNSTFGGAPHALPVQPAQVPYGYDQQHAAHQPPVAAPQQPWGQDAQHQHQHQQAPQPPQQVQPAWGPPAADQNQQQQPQAQQPWGT